MRRLILFAAPLFLGSVPLAADANGARALVGIDGSDLESIPLELVSGELFGSGTEGGAPFDPVSQEPDGTFSQSAGDGQDLRARPAGLRLDLPDASLEARFSQRIGLRNADPATGRPRRFEATGACTDGSEPACLRPPVAHCDHAWLNDGFGIVPNPDYDPACVFEGYGDRAFQRLCEFAGYETLYCSLRSMGPDEAFLGLTFGEVMGRLFAGDGILNDLLRRNVSTTCDMYRPPPAGCSQPPADKGSAAFPFPLPLVLLSNDPGDEESLGCVDLNFDDAPCGGSFQPVDFLGVTLSPVQEAALGCGPFFGTSCDASGIDVRHAEASALLQSWPIVQGVPAALELKEMGVSPAGTEKLDPATGLPLPFVAPSEYRTDEGLQPGTLPWAAAGIGEPICAVEHLGGGAYPLGIVQVPTGFGAEPPARDEALPGCHRKWVDSQQGYLNPAWGTPAYQRDGEGEPILDPATGLPLQERDGAGSVKIGASEQSGDPDPLGVSTWSGLLEFPDSVYAYDLAEPFSPDRPAIGPGHPLASSRGLLLTPERIVPFANELAGLSWNYLVLATAFSSSFGNGLETVGDLADPAGAHLEGGSVYNVSVPSSPASVAANRRLVAQMLFAYCGSDYGVIDSETGLGTCRVDATFNEVRRIRQLLDAEELTCAWDVSLPCTPQQDRETQELYDSLQFVDVMLVQPVDPFDPDDLEINPPAPGPDNILRSQHCSFITPQYCDLVREIASASDVGESFALPGVALPTIARRYWLWETGASHLVDRATGELAAHRRALAFGPFVADRTGAGPDSRTPILLEEPRIEELDLDPVNVPGDRLVTRDWEAGLDWLDAARTAGLSYADILAGVGGWTDAGWRHATTAEICALFRKRYLPDASCPGATDVGTTRGATENFGFVQMLAQPEFSDPPPTLSGKVLGLYDDGNPADGVGLADFTARYEQPGTILLTFITSWSVTPNDRDPTASDAAVGHFLVRPVAVPEPAGDAIRVVALLVLATVARRRSPRRRSGRGRSKPRM